MFVCDVCDVCARARGVRQKASSRAGYLFISTVKCLRTLLPPTYIYPHCTHLQVDQILAMRSELVEVSERARRLEGEKEAFETELASLKAQVCESCIG